MSLITISHPGLDKQFHNSWLLTADIVNYILTFHSTTLHIIKSLGIIQVNMMKRWCDTTLQANQKCLEPSKIFIQQYHSFLSIYSWTLIEKSGDNIVWSWVISTYHCAVDESKDKVLFLTVLLAIVRQCQHIFYQSRTLF